MTNAAKVNLPFHELRKGMRARVASLAGADASRRLQEMGLIEGTEFRVVKVAPLGDPVEIDLRGYRLCLRKGETLGLAVEPLD